MMTVRHLPTLFAAVILGSTSLNAATLEDQIMGLASTVSRALETQNYSSVTVQITGPTIYPGSGPAMVTEVLCGELEKLNISVKRARADVGLTGKLKIHEVTDAGGSDRVTSLVVTITLEFVDRNDNPILSLDSQKMNITDRSDIARLLGIPFEADIPGHAGGDHGQTPDSGIIDGYLKPHQSIQGGSVIHAGGNGGFGIEVIANGRPVPAITEDGLAWIDLKEHDLCHIRLINNADYEVAVELTLDGVDCFWFSPQKKSLWLVKPHSSLTVKGWQLSDSMAREFRIVPFEHSVARKAGATGSIGVIAAGFYRAYQEYESIPDSDRSGYAKGLAFGEGKDFVNHVRTVPRRLGKLRATVPVRYDKPAGY